MLNAGHPNKTASAYKRVFVLSLFSLFAAKAQTADLVSAMENIKITFKVAVETTGDTEYRDLVPNLIAREIRSIPDVTIIDKGTFDYKVRYVLRSVKDHRGGDLGIAVSEVWTWAPAAHHIGVTYAKTMKSDDPKLSTIAEVAKAAADLELVLSNNVIMCGDVDDLQKFIKSTVAEMDSIVWQAQRKDLEKTRGEMIRALQNKPSQ